MSERTSYEPGTPSWVELAGIPDFEAAEGFYRELLGWEIPKHPQTDELGGYRRAQLNGRDVAGASPVMQEGQPCEWNTYVSVADAEATIAKVREAGGTVVVEPLDVMGMGKMAIFNDTVGATCGIWEPGTFAGAALVNEDGAFGWNELGTREAAAAIEFYGRVFGWTAEKDEASTMGAYYFWKDGEEVRGGLFDMSGHEIPADTPASWLVYFTVPDADAAAATTEAAGGGVFNGPVDISVGRLAVLHDPQGATFAVLAPNDKARGEMK
jgi:uncharacterized protein